MLKKSIKSIEVLKAGFFNTELLITDTEENTDEIVVELIGGTNIYIKDSDTNSYELTGKKLSREVRKVSGALNGAILKVDINGASVFEEGYSSSVDVYFEDLEYTTIVTIGNFKVTFKDIDEEKPEIKIEKNR